LQASPPATFPEDDSGSAGVRSRFYNGRDCGDEMDKCEFARDFVRNQPISNISLDITPLFTLARLGDRADLDYGTEMNKVLGEQKGSRVFRDRAGKVVAEGKLKDYRNGRVFIDGNDGEAVQVPFSDLSDDDICYVSAWWSIPTECALGDDIYPGREWIASTLTWKASGVGHKPLYFEEVQLERYGHTAGPIAQPLLSGAHFCLNIAALPYKMGIHPPNECQYALGYYRPGNCAPWLVPPIPLSLRGGLLTAGVYTGGVFAIP
jgi:hypothetical protein